MTHDAAWRMSFDTSVRGVPRWYARYQAEGLCRLKWMGLAGFPVLLIQGLALTSWSGSPFEPAAEAFGVTATTLVTACLLLVAVCIAVLITAAGRRVCTPSQAHALVVITVAGAVSAQAVLLGLSQIDARRMATFDLVLLSVLAAAPLSLRACVGITIAGLAAMLVAVLQVGPLQPNHLWYCLHPASFAALGMVLNRWYLSVFRAQSLQNLKRTRRARQVERQKLRVEKLLEQVMQANMAKTRFLAAASHDLRQPMHAIGMLVGALRQYITYPAVKMIVDRLESSVEATDNLFAALLDISKLDAGAVTPNATTFPIAPLLKQLAVQYAPQAAQKGLAFRVIPSRALVHSDPTLLNRVLMNLVANALRYTEHGRIFVGCKRSGPTELRILVCDTGCGIASDQLEAIFGEFVQLDNPARGRSEGLGLGLAIVSRMAQLLGHEVSVRSRIGRGSIFAVRLPLAGFQKNAVRTPVAPGTSADRVAGSFVVVVDHEQDILFSMDALLTKHGCHVVCARNGDEAVTHLMEHLRTPDLIITDYLVAHDETGLDVIAKICATQEAHIPALIVTGASSGHDLAEITSRGYPIMFKPLTEKQLLAKVAELLRSADDQLASCLATDDTLPGVARQVAESTGAAPHSVLDRG